MDMAARLQGLPRIILDRDREYYWLQAGQKLRFFLRIPPGIQPNPAPPLRVQANHQCRDLHAHPISGMVYTPEHDQRLRRGSHITRRMDTVFTQLIWEDRPCYLTYTLDLHRGRNAFDRHPEGYGVLLVSALATLGLIITKRRSPWWNDFA